MEYINVQSLIAVDELAERLGDEDFRIFDTAVIFNKVDQGLVANSSIETYREAHIPGAAFADVLSDWSNLETPYRNILAIDALKKETGRDWYKRGERGNCLLVNHADVSHTSLAVPSIRRGRKTYGHQMEAFVPGEKRGWR